MTENPSRGTPLRQCDTLGIRPAFAASGRGNEHNEVSHEVSQTAATVATVSAFDTLLARASECKRNVNADWAHVYDTLGDRRAHAEARQKWQRFFQSMYLGAVANVAMTPARVLETRRADLVTRLDRGYDMALDDRVADLFARLLLELEVIEDALLGADEVKRRGVERLHAIEVTG